MIPQFAVVGHPNKGKSSIVATLAQDDSVHIDRVSGSTIAANTYPMAIDGTVLYTLIDTPGFQRARATLAWLKQHCRDVSQRPQAILDFCEQHDNSEKFHNECELLRPIVGGAGIIYVVDGSRPYGPEYEAEMEILRWTGKPSLAIINPIDNETFVADWENALSQYFKTVRTFNAHRAEFTKRTSLLKVFGQLQPDWEQAIASAVASIIRERERQHKQASELIATLLVEVLQHRESQRTVGDTVVAGIETLLAQKYKHTLRQLESRCRRQVEESYAYFKLNREETDLETSEEDLFNQEYWYLFGLNKKQLVTVCTGAGAGTGLIVDVGLGGHSLLLGSVIGGISGGIGAVLFSKQIAKMSIKGLPTGGKLVHYGPVNNPNFPFVILGRALHHLRCIALRTHAVREQLKLEDEPPLDIFGVKEKTQLMSLFKNIGSNKNTFAQREKLVAIINEYASKLDIDSNQF